MKKEVLILFVIFLLASVSALSITVPEKVNQGSTFIATLQGNILNPVAKSDVGFYEGHVQIPLDYDIEKIEDTYYIYALIPYSEKLYTLKINDVYFKENNAFKTEDLEANFSSSNLTADFNVNPGFVITRENSFQLVLYNNLNSNLDITYTLGNIEGSRIIPLQETSELTIDASKIKGTSLNHLIISSPNSQYDIPVYFIRNQTFDLVEINDSNNNSIINFLEGPDLRFSIDKIDETLKIGEGYEYSLILENQGDEDSGEITLKVSDELIDFVSLETGSIENLPPNTAQEIKFSILTKTPIDLEGGILAESAKSSDELKIVLFAGENVAPVSSVKSKLTCNDLNGTICLLSQTCSGTSIPSSDNWCCTNGICQAPGTPTTGGGNNSNTTSIIIVVAALLIILGLIFWRLKKTKKKQIIQSARLEPKKSSSKKDFDVPNFRDI